MPTGSGMTSIQAERDGGDRRRQDRRRARPGGQPRDRLQQEALRRRRDRAADAGLDLGRLPGGGRQADRPVEGTVRLADSRRRQRRHRLALRFRCSGRPAATSCRPTTSTPSFNSEAGVKALTVLQQMAVNDKSLYLDTTNENGPKLMNSGKVAMLVTGPWDLSQLSDIEYGVQVMPTFAGSERRPSDDLRPGQLGGVQQRRQEEAGGDRLRQVVDRARTGQGVLVGHRRSAHRASRLGRTRRSLDKAQREPARQQRPSWRI